MRDGRPADPHRSDPRARSVAPLPSERRRPARTSRRQNPPTGDRATTPAPRVNASGPSRITPLEGAPPLSHPLLEPADVNLIAPNSELVAPPAGDQQPVAEHLTQVRDISLNDLDSARGRLLAPQPVDQPIRRDGLAAMHEQHRQQRPLLGATQRQLAVLIDHLKRPQDSKLDHVYAPQSTLPPVPNPATPPLTGSVTNR